MIRTPKALTVALGLSFLTASAGAQPSPFAADDAGAIAAAAKKFEQRFADGTRFHRAGDFERAYASYLAAWTVRKDSHLAGNLAIVELRLGKYASAAEHLTFALSEIEDREGVARGRIEKTLAVAKAHIGTLTIVVDLDGADIVLDGRVVGQAPLKQPLFVEPGHHVVQARAGERSSPAAEWEASAGAARALSLTLAGSPPEPGPGPRSPSPLASTPAEAWVSGPARSGSPGLARPAITPLPPAGPTSTVKPVPVIAGGVVTVAAALIGAGFLADAHAKQDDRDAIRTQLRAVGACSAGTPWTSECARIHDLNATIQTDKNVSTGLFLASGAAAIATLGYVLFAPRRSPHNVGVSFTPSLSLRSATLTLHAVF